MKVRVAAASLSYQDVVACYHPKQLSRPVIGHDFAGQVISSASGKYPAGTPVIGICHGGGQAGEVWVTEEQLFPLPESFMLTEGAAMAFTYTAAWQLLQVVATLEKTNRLLILAGSGGLGTALITIGKQMGLEMYVTAPARHHKALHALGASPINFEAEDYLRATKRLSIDGAHAVIDLLGSSLAKSWDCLRPKGILISAGNMARERTGGQGIGIIDKAEMAMNNIMGGGKKFIAYDPWAPAWQSRWVQDMQAVLSFMEQHSLAPKLAPIIQPDQACAAMQAIHDGSGPMGKVVVKWVG